MHYIIQENVFREQHYTLLFEALDRLGYPYTVVRIFPFIDKVVDIKDIPDVFNNVEDLPEFEPPSDNVFVFGAIKLAELGVKRGWSPGSLMNENNDYVVYSKYYKDNLLNYDSQILTIGTPFTWQPNEKKFIRPTQDTKSFSGQVFSETEWKDSVEYHLHNFRSERFNEDTEIQVSTVKNIYKEIRFWVVDSKVITGSQYRLGNQLVLDSYYEPEAIEFAQRMVDIYQLASSFVIDVCLTDNGWKIVECGCINCAGFYKSDIAKMIEAVDLRYNGKRRRNFVTFTPHMDVEDTFWHGGVASYVCPCCNKDISDYSLYFEEERLFWSSPPHVMETVCPECNTILNVFKEENDIDRVLYFVEIGLPF